MIVHLHWYVSRELGECWISLASDDYINYSNAQTIGIGADFTFERGFGQPGLATKFSEF